MGTFVRQRYGSFPYLPKEKTNAFDQTFRGCRTCRRCTRSNAVTYTPGTYTEKVNGHNAAFTVKVTVSKNKIEKIEYPDNLETIGVGKVALEKLSKKIIDRQSLGVDNVTGATITSFALKGAVKKALEQAKVSKADMAKLMKNSEKYTALPAEIKTNVVVVGGGGSGLASAIAAQQAGAKVIVLENSASSRLHQRF